MNIYIRSPRRTFGKRRKENLGKMPGEHPRFRFRKGAYKERGKHT